MLDAGVNVGVGVDGGASNDGQNILAETRLAMLLQRAGGDPKGLSARWVRVFYGWAGVGGVFCAQGNWKNCLWWALS